jgi:hypothetical protein
MKTVGVSGESSGLRFAIRRGEAKAFDRVFDRHIKDAGFWEYCRSEEVQSALPELLTNRAEAMQLQAIADNQPYKKELPLNAHHAVKTDMWSQLALELREEWRKKSRERKDGEAETLVTADWWVN